MSRLVRTHLFSTPSPRRDVSVGGRTSEPQSPTALPSTVCRFTQEHPPGCHPRRTARSCPSPAGLAPSSPGTRSPAGRAGTLAFHTRVLSTWAKATLQVLGRAHRNSALHQRQPRQTEQRARPELSLDLLNRISEGDSSTDCNRRPCSDVNTVSSRSRWAAGG